MDTVTQELEIISRLGQAVDLVTGNEKSNSCLHEATQRLALVDKRRFKAFATEEQEQVEIKANASLGVGLSNEEVSIGFKAGLNNYYHQSSSYKKVIGVVVYVETVRKVLDQNIAYAGSIPLEFPDKSCDPNDEQSRFDTVNEFFDICGDGFVRSET